MKTKIILPIFFLMALSLSMFASALDNCSDSDDGTNYFTKGLVIPRAGDEQVWDSCKNSKVLYEGTCDEQGGKVYEYECPGTCEDGACVCSDSDDGKDYFTKGLIISRAGDEQVWDSCKTDYILLEGTCDEQGGAVYEHECLNGCSEGACQKFEPSGETGPVDLPKNISEEEIVMLCNGCGLDGKCYPFNYRKDKNYCSIDKEFIPQLKSESSCENNFECGSNICIDDICVKEGLFKRFLNWFRRLFG